MKSLTHDYLKSLQFSTEQATVLKKIGEYKGRQDLFTRQTPELLESLRQVAIIESSESSNRLEGITAPHDRIEALVLNSKHTMPRNRSEQEIAGYRDALNLIHESAPYMEISTNVILQVHSIIYRYMPDGGGRWKMTDNEIIEKNADGTLKRVRFKPVSAVATPHAMEDLANLYKNDLKNSLTEPLILIPLVILDFLCIHPFRDGNGRTARLLTLLLLYHFDLQVGRYISLERIFEESKETYYETLEASSQRWHEGKHDAYPWINYFWGVLLRAYAEFEDRVGSIKKGKGTKGDQIRKAIDRRIKPFAISDLESDCPGISRDTVRLVLRQLKEEGIILSTGKGRSAKWVKI